MAKFNNQKINLLPNLLITCCLSILFFTAFIPVNAYNDSTGFEKSKDHLITCEGGAYYLYNVQVLDSDSNFNYSFHQYLNTWDEEKPMVYKSAKYPGSGSVKILLVPDSFAYSMPCNFNPVTSHFGWRGKRMHIGTDIDLETGDQVYSVMDGIVRYAGQYKGYGFCVLVRHLNGLETLYAHLSKLSVNAGDVIKNGTELGLGGTTGHSTGSHLHFEVHFMGKAINPELIFNFSKGIIKTHYLIINSDGKSKAFNPESQLEESENTSKLEDENDAADEEAVKPILEIKKVPVKKVNMPAKATQKVHKIKQGDTLYGLAKKYNTTVSQICRLNKISESTTLNIGRVLKVK